MEEEIDNLKKEIKYIKKQQSTLRYLIFSMLTVEQVEELYEKMGKYKIFD